MTRIRATNRWSEIPAWALLERRLIAELRASLRPFLEKYTDELGYLRWGGTKAQHGRDDKDDFYEAFYNWPLLYVLSGGGEVLELSRSCWEAVTSQLTKLGLLDREYDTGADFFHQGEGLNFFYFLCLADPTNPTLRERAQRFANFYTGDDDKAMNYDSTHAMMRSPHTGSRGPVYGYRDGDATPDWPASMSVYGLPFDDVPGLQTFADLSNRRLALELGEVMNERFGRGDVVSNLAVTSLTTNAYLMMGDERYRDWTVGYSRMWAARAEANGGLIPDSIGPDGMVGSLMGGRWFGGLYGWTWPHGFYSISQSTLIAGLNTYLLTGEDSDLDVARTQIDRIVSLGYSKDIRSEEMSLVHHWLPHLGFENENQLRDSPSPVECFVVPYRYKSSGWFDYQPILPATSVALWQASMSAEDWQRIEKLGNLSGEIWNSFSTGREKEDAGHEAPWVRFLDGRGDDYPEKILNLALVQVARRLQQVREDHVDLLRVGDDEVHTLVHHWQKLNPVTTEALVQLTLGCSQHLYNGGLLFGRVRYFDAEQGTPGLPEDVAALVSSLAGDAITVELINLSTAEDRAVMVQAGMFAQDQFTSLRYDMATDAWQDRTGNYSMPPQRVSELTELVETTHIWVDLPAGRRITLHLGVSRNAAIPTYDSLSKLSPRKGEGDFREVRVSK